MSFGQKGFYLWELFFSWKGRLNRKPFLLIILITDMVIFAPGALISGIYAETFQEQLFIWHILDLIILIITSCPTIKRLHDCGYSGQWYVLFLFLFIATLLSPFMILTLIWMLLMCSILVFPGTKGPNAYGPDPLDSRLK